MLLSAVLYGINYLISQYMHYMLRLFLAELGSPAHLRPAGHHHLNEVSGPAGQSESWPKSTLAIGFF